MKETNHEPEPTKPKFNEPTLQDIGTRYQHLLEHYEALEAVVDILKSKDYLSQIEKVKLIKLSTAAEVTRATIDAYAGFNDSPGQYSLYHLIENLPLRGEVIEGGRGTPLI
jgi:hypothetical protein